MQQPKVHPLYIGAAYGLAAAVLQVLTIYINHAALSKSNGILGFVGTGLLPFIALILAGHYAGRHQRLTKIQANATGLAAKSVLSGTGAGLAAGIVYVILSEVSGYVTKFLPHYPVSDGGVLSVIGNVLGLLGWFFLGLVAGTLGGVLGDSRAHKDIKSGAASKVAAAK